MNIIWRTLCIVHSCLLWLYHVLLIHKRAGRWINGFLTIAEYDIFIKPTFTWTLVPSYLLKAFTYFYVLLSPGHSLNLHRCKSQSVSRGHKDSTKKIHTCSRTCTYWKQEARPWATLLTLTATNLSNTMMIPRFILWVCVCGGVYIQNCILIRIFPSGGI